MTENIKSRRKFLKAGAAVAAGLGFGPKLKSKTPRAGFSWGEGRKKSADATLGR